MDITSLRFSDNYFDYILCIHVLEHVVNDNKGMAELFRVLKPGGWAIIQVPLDRTLQVTLEGCHIEDPNERRKIFGNDDHVRSYGADYKTKLEFAGFHVKVDDFSLQLTESDKKYFGISLDEDIYFCTKPFEREEHDKT
jgi:ubiquinone/menaquinone biosynthesis C-methylase UbiE